jgi:hypothetical protein
MSPPSARRAENAADIATPGKKIKKCGADPRLKKRVKYPG